MTFGNGGVRRRRGVGDPRRPLPSQLIFKTGAATVGDFREGKITMEELLRQVRISQF